MPNAAHVASPEDGFDLLGVTRIPSLQPLAYRNHAFAPLDFSRV